MERRAFCGHLKLRCRDCGWSGNQASSFLHSRLNPRHLVGQVVEPICAVAIDGGDCPEPVHMLVREDGSVFA